MASRNETHCYLLLHSHKAENRPENSHIEGNLFSVSFLGIESAFKGGSVNDSAPKDVTALLLSWSAGDEEAPARLMPLVYEELRRLARNYLRRERPDHTLQPTALVNEVYLRIVDQRRMSMQNRAQFFGLAALLMRRILVDHARTRATERSAARCNQSSLWTKRG